MMSDLLSYSIMMNGEKAVTHTSPHFAPLTVGKPEKVTLPPIAHGLTENNLNLLNQTLFLYAVASATPSLTSLLALELPLSSPRLAGAELFATSQPLAQPLTQPLTQPQVAQPQLPQPQQLVLALTTSAQKKRRQRLGPSCDNCRARKVKCNAEVIMLTRHFSAADPQDDLDEYTTLGAEQQQQVRAGGLVRIAGNFVLVLSHNKLIKFRPCLSCAGKGLACCFSKGFTKEDIVHSKRSGSEPAAVMEKKAQAPAKVAKKRVESGSTRKSSCGACRKRKVKCVMNPRLNRCVGCIKKDGVCSVEAC